MDSSYGSEEHPINLYMSMGFSEADWGGSYFRFRRFFTENQLLTLRQIFLYNSGDASTLPSATARVILNQFADNGVYSEAALRVELYTLERTKEDVSFPQFLHINLRLKQASGDSPAEGVFSQETVLEVQADYADSRSFHSVSLTESEELAEWVESSLMPFRDQDALLMEVLPFLGKFSPEMFLDGRLYVRLLSYLAPGSISEAPSPRLGRLKKGAQAFHALNRMSRVLEALKHLGRNTGAWAAEDLVQNNPHTVFAALKHIRAAVSGDGRDPDPGDESQLDSALRLSVGEWAKKKIVESKRPGDSPPMSVPPPTLSPSFTSPAPSPSSPSTTPLSSSDASAATLEEERRKRVDEGKRVADEEAVVRQLRESDIKLREELAQMVLRQKQLESNFDSDERRIRLLELQLSSQSDLQGRVIADLRDEVAAKDATLASLSERRQVETEREYLQRHREEMALAREWELEEMTHDFDRREKELLSLQTELDERQRAAAEHAELSSSSNSISPAPTPATSLRSSSISSSGSALSSSNSAPQKSRRWLLAYDGGEMVPLWHCLDALGPKDTLVVFNAGAQNSSGVLEGVREKMLQHFDESQWPNIVFEFSVTGHAGAAVLHATRRNQCTTIVLGHSKRSAIKKITEGSVTSFLLKHLRGVEDIRIAIIE